VASVKPRGYECVRDFGQGKFVPINVLVNNAGVMPLWPLHELKIDEWNRMIDVNIRGVLHGIAVVLPGMRARKSGQIIKVSSIGGHQVWPTCAVYIITSPLSQVRNSSALDDHENGRFDNVG
jgi:NADP-dependent 3-hydroxy acid dehydrogenase YdfG